MSHAAFRKYGFFLYSRGLGRNTREGGFWKKNNSFWFWSWTLVGVLFALLTGSLPASPVLQGGVKGSYTKIFIFLTGKPRPSGRGGFTSPKKTYLIKKLVMLPRKQLEHFSTWRRF